MIGNLTLFGHLLRTGWVSKFIGFTIYPAYPGEHGGCMSEVADLSAVFVAPSNVNIGEIQDLPEPTSRGIRRQAKFSLTLGDSSYEIEGRGPNFEMAVLSGLLQLVPFHLRGLFVGAGVEQLDAQAVKTQLPDISGGWHKGREPKIGKPVRAVKWRIKDLVEAVLGRKCRFTSIKEEIGGQLVASGQACPTQDRLTVLSMIALVRAYIGRL